MNLLLIDYLFRNHTILMTSEVFWYFKIFYQILKKIVLPIKIIELTTNVGKREDMFLTSNNVFAGNGREGFRLLFNS